MQCVDRYRHTDGEVSMVRLYQELLEYEEELKVLVYSGDDDGVCGTVGTQEWIWDLGFKVRSAPSSVQHATTFTIKTYILVIFSKTCVRVHLDSDRVGCRWTPVASGRSTLLTISWWDSTQSGRMPDWAF
jgi:hypothetical protein